VGALIRNLEGAGRHGNGVVEKARERTVGALIRSLKVGISQESAPKCPKGTKQLGLSPAGRVITHYAHLEFCRS
jgi:hypothetical protein